MEFDLCGAFLGCGFGPSAASVLTCSHPYGIYGLTGGDGTPHRPGNREGAGRRHRRCRESRIPCDRRERGMFRRATVGSASGGTAPQGKVAGESSKPPDGGFEGLRIQPCSLCFRSLCSRERPMPGLQARTRHAGAAPVAPPHRAGGGKGRRVRDVQHRCSRRETRGCAEMFRGREGADRRGRLGCLTGWRQRSDYS